MTTETELRLPALEVRQNSERVLYSFAVDGKLLPKFVAVSRLGRDDFEKIQGYQRPEVLSHIAEIRRYLESESPMIPNALVAAFDESVRFEPASECTDDCDYCRTGTLVIPVKEGAAESEKPGWLVDGQQRTAAIREARISGFPICVVGFIAGSVHEQRSQFILVNSTKPLPKGLIYELLPSTEGCLPGMLQRRRFPAYLMERLNLDADSPLHKMIRTPTNSEGVIKDNSILKMIENSLTDGVLYRYRDPLTGEGDVESMLSVLKLFWSAAAEVFSEAWAIPARRSRLMHGVGIVSLGFVMDTIADRYRAGTSPTREEFIEHLAPLTDACRWTNGFWDFGPGAQRKWNELQNTSKDIQLLTNYLLIQYRERVWDHSRCMAPVQAAMYTE